MDVTCERCGTEYEFDETLVSNRGTTVKCTNCGHLFKVFRPDAEGQSARPWNVQSADGMVRTLSSLKELQRLITGGSLTENDLIARGDDDYKRLGDIAELSTFFAAAAAGSADTLGARKRTATTPGMASAPEGIGGADTTVDHRAPVAPRAPPPRRPQSTILGVGSGSQPLPRESARPAPARPPPPTPSQPAPPPPRAPVADATMPERPAARPAPQTPHLPPPSAPPAPPSPSERPLYLDDHEPVVPVRGQSRSGLWVALVVLLAVAVGVALGWPQIAPLLGLAEAPSEANPAAPHIEAGDTALAQDTVPGYEDALSQYLQALAYDAHDVTVLTRLSQANALWAQALEFDASDLEATAETDPARRGEANAVRRELQRHAATALESAENAVRYGSGNASAEVALADALRLTGDLSRSRSRLERALTLDSHGSMETLRVQALVTAAEADGNLAAARELAEQSVAEDPSSIRARLLYARTLLAAREVSGARSQLDAILRRDPRHPRAVALRDAIQEGRPPAPPTVDTPDAGTAAAPTETPTEAPTEQPVQPPVPAGGIRREGTGGGGGGVPAHRDYGWYVRRGDELLARNDLAGALEHYDAARADRPGGSEALTGVGQVLLRQGDANGAAARFRQAAGQGYGEAYIGLGQAYRRMGRNNDALTAFERYLQRMPTGPQASLARRQAEELRGLVEGGSEGGSPPPTPPEGDQLPPPVGMDRPPPEDVPAIGSEP